MEVKRGSQNLRAIALSLCSCSTVVCTGLNLLREFARTTLIVNAWGRRVQCTCEYIVTKRLCKIGFS